MGQVRRIQGYGASFLSLSLTWGGTCGLRSSLGGTYETLCLIMVGNGGGLIPFQTHLHQSGIYLRVQSPTGLCTSYLYTSVIRSSYPAFGQGGVA